MINGTAANTGWQFISSPDDSERESDELNRATRSTSGEHQLQDSAITTSPDAESLKKLPANHPKAQVREIRKMITELLQPKQ